ncbi:unnamed protein product [Euphydryas editha]|uniref:Uncharacterized protein n=1 Tax=Euphydryas editha TaxID=104508 RepID=A0AAU9V3D4_EUPED|nr:unnamed protein product [Euphydryas editha]
MKTKKRRIQQLLKTSSQEELSMATEVKLRQAGKRDSAAIVSVHLNEEKHNNRKFRELFTKKTSRIDTNTDLINRLLVSSDPVISSLRARPKTKHGQITREVCELLEAITPAGHGELRHFPSDSLESDEDSSESEKILINDYH